MKLFAVDLERITRRTLNTRQRGKTDWSRLDQMTDEQAEDDAASDVENGLWTETQLAEARLVMPDERTKVPVYIRIDAEVLEYFKSQGPRYQTRINAVLRSYMRSMRSSKTSQ